MAATCDPSSHICKILDITKRDSCAGLGQSSALSSAQASIGAGRVNPMQFAGLDGPLAELIPPCTDPARLDASQDRRFRHPDGFSGLPQGVTHLLRSVPRTDPRNGAAEWLTG
jgi:hypothetical protein